ncbi:SET domain-containing protein [Xylariaceae sp. FL1272]|nr:SET domain-containing protein [Xylariaceae sp. FL1272]
MSTLPDGLAVQGTKASPRGRKLVASQTFNPGDVIATFEKPCIAIPDSPHLESTCSGCLAPSATVRSVRACTGCRAVAYCSSTCQKLDWVEGGHKAECKIFKRVLADGHPSLPTPVRALVQVLIRPDMFAALQDVEGHVDKFRQNRAKVWADMELQAMGALHYLGREATPRRMAEAIDILCKLQVNSFNRLDDDVGQTGFFLNPSLAMINHSCIPNAFVQLSGRQAIVHASQEIKKDQEIEISYIDYASPRSTRQEALKERYHFTCPCPRCKEDLDVYQVAKQYPHLSLNTLSLIPDIEQKLDSLSSSPQTNNSLDSLTKDIYPWCSIPLNDMPAPEKAKQLRQRWRACAPILPTNHYAIEPLPQLFNEATVYFGAKADFASTLAVSTFIALNINPITYPTPFHPQRVKDLIIIAKLLSNVAPWSAESKLLTQTATNNDLMLKLAKIDHATICQVLAELVVHYGPMAHSKEWQICKMAQDMLNDIEALPGRDTENSLVKAFMRNPNGAVERQFFEQTILDPVREISSFGLDVMDKELGSRA